MTKRLTGVAHRAACVCAFALVAQAAAAQEVLRVAAPLEEAPFSFIDIADGQFVGALVEIMREAGVRAGLQIEFEAAPEIEADWVAMLESGDVDLAIGSLTPGESRSILTEPLFLTRLALFVPVSDTREYVSSEDLRNLTVGVMRRARTTPPLQASGIFADIWTFEITEGLLAAIADGSLRHSLLDRALGSYLLLDGRFPSVRLVPTYRDWDDMPVGIAAHQSDQELLTKVMAAIAALRESGDFSAISARWGISDLVR